MTLILAIHTLGMRLVGAVLAADLPSPPMWERWILERPLPVAGALVVCGVIGLVVMNQRGRLKRGVALLVGFICAGALVWGIGAAVTTERETLEEATRRLIVAVTESDVKSADELLHSRLVIASAGTIVPGGFTKADALRVVEGYLWFKIDDWNQRPNGAVIDGPNVGRSQTVVRVRSSYYGDSTHVPMTWEFTWERGFDDQWRVTRVELVSMWGQQPPQGWVRMARSAADAAAAGTTGAPDPPQNSGPFTKDRH